MKNLLLFSYVFFQCLHMQAQQGMWTWMNGDNTFNSQGTFGIQGVPSPLNTPPALYEACEWTDLQGNFWLYGGLRSGSGTNAGSADLWKFNILTNEWTWMFGNGLSNQFVSYGIKGVAASTNTPGPRMWGTGTWVDLQGNLWLYGGFSLDSIYATNGMPADLWKYDISTNLWTWVNGINVFSLPNREVVPTLTHPGSRMEFNSTWTDNQGNFWLFGGVGSSNNYSDLWKYEIATDTWTLMKGNINPNQFGSYGVLGVASPSNIPPARACCCKWKDNNGELWLFGGGIKTSGNFNACMDDLWKFNVVTNNWTWMGGGPNPANYGIKCNSNNMNQPKTRFENRACWVDKCNNLWMFGGDQTVSGHPCLNDLWMFNTNTSLWTWVSGNTTPLLSNNYGTKGVPNLSNSVCSRMGSIGWSDSDGNFWLFGGISDYGILNDLWRFTPDTLCCGCIPQPPTIAFQSSDTNNCEKTCINFNDLSTNNPTSWQWFFPGADSLTSAIQNPVGICYNNYGSFDITLIACNANGCDTLIVPGFISIFQSPSAPTIIQNLDTLICTTPASGYQWYLNNVPIAGATQSTYTIAQQGLYYVIITDSNQCNTASNSIVITGLNFLVIEDLQTTINPNPNDGSFTIEVNSTILIKNLKLEIANVLGETVYSKNLEYLKGKFSEPLNLKSLPKGVYLLKVIKDEKITTTRIILN